MFYCIKEEIDKQGMWHVWEERYICADLEERNLKESKFLNKCIYHSACLAASP
jgi:hypothetical protein